MSAPREGNLEAPTRHPVAWKAPDFLNEVALQGEMERVFNICHGCRRCVSLCHSFPTLFELIDAAPSMEIDSVAKTDYDKVVDHCYLCDLCYMTKCPYVPPHEWNVDFPHLMLRAKAVKHAKGETRLRDRVLTSTDTVGRFAGIPIVAPSINAVNKLGLVRRILQRLVGIHAGAWLPQFSGRSLRRRLAAVSRAAAGETAVPAGRTRGRVALFATCYMNRNEPGPGEDLVAVYKHNGIVVRLAAKENCCGMPKLELGDLKAVEKLKNGNIPGLARLVDEGWDLTALIPSCVLMFKKELPLLFPDDAEVAKVAAAFYDPFEYLMLRHKEGRLRTDFANRLGKVAYQVSCHQRVQNIGPKTREALLLVPGTEIEMIERCSGHDGTYAVKAEFHDYAMKIVRPVVNRIRQFGPDHFGSDCAMAGHHIAHALAEGKPPEHPMTLLRHAYGI